MQALNSVQYEGEEYLLVESMPGLGFHPEQFGIVTEKLHTACWRGFACTFAIRDGGLFLDSLEVLAKDGRYPEINGVSPACRGGPLRPAIYFGLGRVRCTGTLRFGNDRDRTYHVDLFGPSTWMPGSRAAARAPRQSIPSPRSPASPRKDGAAKLSTGQRYYLDRFQAPGGSSRIRTVTCSSRSAWANSFPRISAMNNPSPAASDSSEYWPVVAAVRGERMTAALV